MPLICYDPVPLAKLSDMTNYKDLARDLFHPGVESNKDTAHEVLRLINQAGI